MINIELENENENVSNEFRELRATCEYIEANPLLENRLTWNYDRQDEYVLIEFEKELANVEKELFKKWNLKGGIYVDDEDSALGSVIIDNLTDKYFEARTMSEINNGTLLNNCKNEIVKYFDTELDKYAKGYNLESNIIQNIKKDVPDLVKVHFDKVADRLFNDKIRDKLEKLCGKLEVEYNNENYAQMDKIAKEIEKICSKNTTVYRDYELMYRLSTNIEKNNIVQNKLAKGKEGKLSEIEEEVLTKFSTSTKEENIEINDELKKELDEYKDLLVKKYMLTDEEKSRMEELKEKLNKIEKLPKMYEDLLSDSFNKDDNMFKEFLEELENKKISK